MRALGMLDGFRPNFVPVEKQTIAQCCGGAERLRIPTATRMLLTFPTTHFATLDLVDSKLLWGYRHVARFGSVGHPITPLKTMCRLDLEESPV